MTSTLRVLTRALQAVLVLLLSFLPGPVCSFLVLPSSISSDMVLQREPQSARLWGAAAGGSVVEVQLDGGDAASIIVKAMADNAGQWSVQLPPQPASVDRSVTVSSDGAVVQLVNVAFGDVYLCSGQSNMVIAVLLAFDANETIAESGNYPHLRLFSIDLNPSDTVLNDSTPLWHDGQRWVVSQPKYVGDNLYSFYSAVCYHFGRFLYRAVNNATAVVPIGLIESCVGGTRVEAWTSEKGNAKCGPVTPPAASELTAQQQSSTLPIAASPSSRLGQPGINNATVLWKGMIAPLLPMRLTGVVWYQGEANANDAVNYDCRWPAMIEDWREQFQNFALHFNFVLLAAFREGGDPSWSLIRDAQLTALSLPYTAVGSAQDLGDEASPGGAIHPRNKSILGHRLAYNAMHDIYGMNVVHTGPQAADVVWPNERGAVQSVLLRFRSDLLSNAGLQLLDTANCTGCCQHLNGSAISLVTSDGETRRANVSVFSTAYVIIATVNVPDAPSDLRVTGLLLNWEQYPECGIYNADTIPMLPMNLPRP